MTENTDFGKNLALYLNEYGSSATGFAKPSLVSEAPFFACVSFFVRLSFSVMHKTRHASLPTLDPHFYNVSHVDIFFSAASLTLSAFVVATCFADSSTANILNSLMNKHHCLFNINI